MNKWTAWVVILGLAMAMAMINGCEWGGVTDDVSSSTDGTNGPSPTPGQSNGQQQISETEMAVFNEALGDGVAGQTSYSGSLLHKPDVAGSVTIMAGGFHFTDNGDKTLSGDMPGTSGSIEYSTGSWAIDLGGADISAEQHILGNYVYLIVTTNTL